MQNTEDFIDFGERRPAETVAVILNYNDADTTMRQLNRIRSYQCIDAVLLVDNNSTDASFIRLKACVKDHIVLLRALKNGGYGAGNNLGLRYAKEILGAKYAFIANPDAEFSEECAEELLRVMKRHPELGLIAPVKAAAGCSEETCIPGSYRNVITGAAAWPVRPWLYDLLESGPVSRRIFAGILHYGRKYYEGKNCVYAGAVPGSFFLADIDKMLSCGAYDENVFLYAEEYILAWKMKEKGYRTALLLRESYVHRHSLTIRKTFRALIRRQKLREKSTLYYYRNYLKISRLQMLFTRLFFTVVNAEVLILEWLG